MFPYFWEDSVIILKLNQLNVLSLLRVATDVATTTLNGVSYITTFSLTGPLILIIRLAQSPLSSCDIFPHLLYAIHL